MKQALVLILGMTGLASMAAANSLSCQSYTSGSALCTHAMMPLLSQIDTTNGEVLQNGHWASAYATNIYNSFNPSNQSALGFNSGVYTMGLLEYVNKTYNYKLGWDPGWCGGVASAMDLKTYGVEVGSTNSYLTDANAVSFIVNTFIRVGTNIKNGGTYDSGVQNTFSSVTGHASQPRSFVSLTDYLSSMPLYAVHVHSQGGDHMMSLNGVDGSYYKMFDPWGSIYNVTVNNGTITYVNGTSWGFMPDDGAGQIQSIQSISGYLTVEPPPRAPVTSERILVSSINSKGFSIP